MNMKKYTELDINTFKKFILVFHLIVFLLIRINQLKVHVSPLTEKLLAWIRSANKI